MITTPRPEFFPVRMENSFEEDPYIPGEFQSVEERKIIRRTDTMERLANVSSMYALVPHDDVYDTVVNALDEVLEGDYSSETSFDNNGARMKVQFRVPALEINLTDNDNIIPCVIVHNSYDLSLKCGINIGAYRPICSNGLMSWKKLYGINARHLGTRVLDWINKDSAKTLVDSFINRVIPLWKKATEIEVSRPEAEAVYENQKAFFPQGLLERAKELWDTKAENAAPAEQVSSSWVLYNTFTNAITHPVHLGNGRKYSIHRETVLHTRAGQLLNRMVGVVDIP